MEIIRNADLDCELQIIKSDDQIWFKGKTVCDALGYQNSNEALKMHVREKHKKSLGDVNPREILGLKGNAKNQIFISEPGLYSLIMKSKMPQAEEFQDWIYEDVLPSLRKTGKYEIKSDPLVGRGTLADEIDQLTEINEFISGMNIGSDRKKLLYDYVGTMCLSGKLDEAKVKVGGIGEITKKIINLRQKDTVKNQFFAKLYDEFKLPPETPKELNCYQGTRIYDVPEDKTFF